MNLHKNTVVRSTCFIFSIFLEVSLFGACSEKHSPMPPPDILSEQQTVNIVRKLEAAKELDKSNASAPGVGEIAMEDFLEQAQKADIAIKELRHGFEVPRAQIEDALWAPPRSLSPEQRTALIRGVRQERRTDRNEQRMLTDWFHSGWPADTATFDQQKHLDDSVIKELEIGEDVHWSQIREAMQVPGNGY
jgi:hypothetical protein